LVCQGFKYRNAECLENYEKKFEPNLEIANILKYENIEKPAILWEWCFGLNSVIIKQFYFL